MRRFTICDGRFTLETLGLRISPSTLVATSTDPLPDPEPDPTCDPGTEGTVSPLPAPSTGPIGPGSS